MSHIIAIIACLATFIILICSNTRPHLNMKTFSTKEMSRDSFLIFESLSIIFICEKYKFDHIKFTILYREYINLCCDRVGVDAIFQTVGSELTKFRDDTIVMIINNMLNPNYEGIISRDEVEALMDKFNFRKDYNQFLVNYAHTFKSNAAGSAPNVNNSRKKK